MKVHVLVILVAINLLASCGGGSNLLGEDPSITTDESIDLDLLGDPLSLSDDGQLNER